MSRASSNIADGHYEDARRHRYINPDVAPDAIGTIRIVRAWEAPEDVDPARLTSEARDMLAEDLDVQRRLRIASASEAQDQF